MESNGVSRSDVYGFLLGGLFDSVNDTIQQATSQMQNAGMELEIEAGQEISRAIEEVKNAYKDQLDYTVDKVKKEAKDAFDRLSSMVQKFQTGVDKDLQEVMGQAQQLANSLPFSSKQPQLTSLKPRYLVVSDLAKTALVQFKGNFPWSAKSGFEASLVLAKQPCVLVDSTTQSLTFQVPQSAFDGAAADKYSYRAGLLSVPWDDGIIWSHKTQFDYQIGLGALPQLAGKGSVEYVANTTERVPQHTTNNYKFNGNDFYPEHWHTVFTKIYPQPGWTIDVSKQPVMNAHHQHGDHKQSIDSVSPTEIVLKVELYCRSGEDIGIVNIDVAFDEYQDRPVQNKRSEDFQMNWKDSKLLEPKEGEVISKVVFDDYKGTHHEFGAPSIDDRSVLKVEAEGNGKWKVWAEPPSTIAFASSDLSKKLTEDIATAHRLQNLLTLANLPKEIRLKAPVKDVVVRESGKAEDVKK